MALKKYSQIQYAMVVMVVLLVGWLAFWLGRVSVTTEEARNLSEHKRQEAEKREEADFQEAMRRTRLEFTEDGTPRLPFPPDNLTRLAIDSGVFGEFTDVSFAWGNGPVNWEYTTTEERGQLLFGNDGGFIRQRYNNDTVRIREVYYDPQHIRSRWQEELRNGAWVRHGPAIFWPHPGDKGGDLRFRIDGEIEGTVSYFDTEGNLTRSEKWHD